MSNHFENQDSHVIDYVVNRGRTIKGEKKITQVTPDQAGTISFGSTITWNMDKNNGCLLDKNGSKLIMVLSALSGGSGGTYNRFIDAAIIYAFKRFEIHQENQPVRIIPADEVFNHILYNSTPDEYAEISRRLRIDSTTNRNSLAAAAQTLSLDLRYISDIFARYIDRDLLKDKFELKGVLRDNLLNIVQTDHSTLPTFTITSCYLDLHWVKPKAKVLMAMREEYFKNGKKSKPFFDHECTINELALASGATQALVKLPELENKNVIDLHPIIRLNSVVDSLTGASDYTGTYHAPTSWNLKNNGNFIDGLHNDISFAYYANSLFPSYGFKGERNIQSGTSLRNEFVYSFAHNYDENDVDKKNYHGSRHFNENATELTINFSALGAAGKCYTLINRPKMMQIVDGLIVDTEGK